LHNCGGTVLTSCVAEVFGKGNVLDDVAAEWVGGFDTDDAQPIADLFTFLFRCAGCDHKVESHDVQDEDNFPTKIKDVAEEYQAVCVQ
jgi:cohesin complex subunit SA-1/2